MLDKPKTTSNLDVVIKGTETFLKNSSRNKGIPQKTIKRVVKRRVVDFNKKEGEKK